MRVPTRVAADPPAGRSEVGTRALGALVVTMALLLVGCMAQAGTSPGPVGGPSVWPFERRFGVQVENLTPFEGELVALDQLVMRVEAGQTVQGAVRVPHDGQRLPLAFRVFDEHGTPGIAAANPRTYRPSSRRSRANHSRWTISCRDIAWKDGRPRHCGDYLAPRDGGVVQARLPYNRRSGVTAVQVVNATPNAARLFRDGRVETVIPPAGIYYLYVRSITHDRRRLPSRNVQVDIQFIDEERRTLVGVLGRGRSYRLVTRDAAPQLNQLVLTVRSVSVPR